MEAVIGGETFIIPKRKKSARKLKKIGFILAVLAYPMILFGVFWIGGNVNSFLLAFQKITISGERVFVGFDNFVSFSNSFFGATDNIGHAFGNSIKTYFLNLLITMPLYLLFSYLIFKKCFAHKQIRVLSMLPSIISGFVLSLIFFRFTTGTGAPFIKITKQLGFNGGEGIDLFDENYIFGTCIFWGIYCSFGTNLLVYPNAMKEIDTGIVESARLDGVTGMFQDLRYIILPLIFPTLTTFLITGLSTIFTNDLGLLAFYGPYYGGTNAITLGYVYSARTAMASTSYLKEMQAFPELAAGGIILTLIVAPATILLKTLLEKFGPSTEA